VHAAVVHICDDTDNLKPGRDGILTDALSKGDDG
jgi:hypothetical protein